MAIVDVTQSVERRNIVACEVKPLLIKTISSVLATMKKQLDNIWNISGKHRCVHVHEHLERK